MILCCGEALIDMVPVEGANGESTYAPLSGGAVFNTSIALGRLELPVKCLSGISNDLFGEQLVNELHASNVATDLLIRSKRPTTLAFVKLIDGHAQYTFYDENSAGRMIETSELPLVGSDVEALYFGGISLCVDPAATTYENLATREGGQKVVMVDPNIRISFIDDEDAYRGRIDRMIAVADIVKTSAEDLDWMIPGDIPLETKVSELHKKGAGIVILTKGSKGAEAHVQGQDPVFVSAPKVTVADTVGAGDTFNAGFLAQLHKLGLLNKAALQNIDGDSLGQALEFAAKVAAITVSRSGANPPYLSEL